MLQLFCTNSKGKRYNLQDRSDDVTTFGRFLRLILLLEFYRKNNSIPTSLSKRYPGNILKISCLYVICLILDIVLEPDYIPYCTAQPFVHTTYFPNPTCMFGHVSCGCPEYLHTFSFFYSFSVKCHHNIFQSNCSGNNSFYHTYQVLLLSPSQLEQILSLKDIYTYIYLLCQSKAIKTIIFIKVAQRQIDKLDSYRKFKIQSNHPHDSLLVYFDDF